MKQLGEVLQKQLDELADRAPCYFCERTGKFKRRKFKLTGRISSEVACPLCLHLIAKEQKAHKDEQIITNRIRIKRPPRRKHIR
jgi:hypothetical protein